MDPFVKDRLEDYLSGDLPDADLERFEAKLSEDPEAAAEVARLTETSSLFEAMSSGKPAMRSRPGAERLKNFRPSSATTGLPRCKASTTVA